VLLNVNITQREEKHPFLQSHSTGSTHPFSTRLCIIYFLGCCESKMEFQYMRNPENVLSQQQQQRGLRGRGRQRNRIFKVMYLSYFQSPESMCIRIGQILRSRSLRRMNKQTRVIYSTCGSSDIRAFDSMPYLCLDVEVSGRSWPHARAFGSLIKKKELKLGTGNLS